MQKFGAMSLQVKHDKSQGTQNWGDVPVITKLLMHSVERMHIPNYLITNY